MTESELIRKCKQGNREAFNHLVLEYQSRVVNMCYGMLSNREDAYDAAQEVFIKAYRGIGNFREKSSFSTWLYRITANVCSDFLRKRQKSVSTVSINIKDDSDDDINAAEKLADNAPLPEERAELAEKYEAIRIAMSELKEEYRIIITLCDIRGMNYEEISAILRIPHGTVKSRLNRARTALRKKLSEKMELFE